MKILKEIFNNQFQIKKLSILKIILIFVLIQILTFAIAFIPAQFIWAKYPDDYLFASLLFSFSFLLSIFLLMLLYREKNLDDYDYNMAITEKPKTTPIKFSKKVVLYSIMIGAGFLLLNTSTLYHFTSYIPVPESIQTAFDDIYAQGFMFIFFSVVIEAAFVEELFMRGFFLNGLLKKYSPKFAIFASAFMFGLIHGNIPQFITALLIGCILGLVYYHTKSLATCIIIHAANNAIAFLAFMPDSLLPKIIVSIVYFVIGFILFKKGFYGLELDKGLKSLFSKEKEVQNI